MLACASMGTPAKGSGGDFGQQWGERSWEKGYKGVLEAVAQLQLRRRHPARHSHVPT
ncbi:hypothetical protein FJNA_00540 [Thermus sp. FJN-A]